MSDLKETLERLYGRIAKGTKLGLSRMQAACDTLDNPERTFHAVHVAGSNGKGSVCAFVASMLNQRPEEVVGLYTSPHLCRFAERIQISGEPISDEQVAKHVATALDADPELTFFEAATLAAFLAFREAGVTTAVIETGLGGRLDATNVIPAPKVAAITRIAYDHADVLGDSLAKIAKEKAGIIKSGSKVVLGKLHPDAGAVIDKQMEDVGAEQVALTSAEPYPGAQLAYPRMAMFGTNLAVAMTVARQLQLTPEQMSRGVEATTWPGRNELLHRSGQELTLLDCCHNPDGAVLLSHIIDATASETVGNRRSVVLVFGACADKNWKAMLDRLSHTAAHRIYVRPDTPRAAPIESMKERYSGELASSVADALKMARNKVGARGLVVVTGSIFLVGPARAILLGLPTDPPVSY